MADDSKVILADALYPISEVKRRLGFGEWAWRSFKKRLRTVQLGKGKVVRGRAVIAAIESMESEAVAR